MEKLIIGAELVDYVKQITSKEEFAFFLRCLVQDYIENRHEWENTELPGYLEALSGYVVDTENFNKSKVEKIDINYLSWRTVAEMLIAASVYE
jgi:hypothetical protein